MPTETPRLAYGADPLREVTRKTRRSLLGVSALGITIVKAQLFPTQLVISGMSFALPDKSIFLIILASLVMYFLVGFVVYAVSDFLLWQERVYLEIRAIQMDAARNFFDELKKRLEKRCAKGESEQQTMSGPNMESYEDIVKAIKPEIEEAFSKVNSKYAPPFSWLKPVTWIRMVLEFVFPLLVGVCSLYCILDFGLKEHILCWHS